MQPMIVTVGPLVTADADGISASQTAPGAFALAINGALSSGFSATSIAQAQAVAGAGNLTLNGSLVSAGVAYLGDGAYVAITSAGNDTGITFTVKGILYGPNSQGGTYQQETLTGSNTSIVVTTKRFSTVTAVTASNAAAGNVSVGVNGTATLDMGRRIIVTSGGNDSAKTFTITGTDGGNNILTQTITGANIGAATTTVDFKTVTSITCSAATAGTVTVGTNGVAASRPVFLDNFSFAPTALQVSVSGTVNYTVQQSLDDPNSVGLANVNWVSHPDTALVGATATAQGNYAYAPRVTRILLNSGSGTVTYTVLQSANVPL
jgi:hypothetical protein